jgi:hypothetical protein
MRASATTNEETADGDFLFCEGAETNDPPQLTALTDKPSVDKMKTPPKKRMLENYLVDNASKLPDTRNIPNEPPSGLQVPSSAQLNEDNYGLSDTSSSSSSGQLLNDDSNSQNMEPERMEFTEEAIQNTDSSVSASSIENIFEPSSEDQQPALRVWSCPAQPTGEVRHSREFDLRFNTPHLKELGEKVEIAILRRQNTAGKSASVAYEAQATFKAYTSSLVLVGDSSEDCDLGAMLTELEKMGPNAATNEIDAFFSTWVPKLKISEANKKNLLNLHLFQAGQFFKHTIYDDYLSEKNLNEFHVRFGNMVGHGLLGGLRKVINVFNSIN